MRLLKEMLCLALLIGSILSGLAQTVPSEKAARPVTWAKDIAPLVFTHCTPCHHPGEVAPFALQTYSDMRKRAKQIAIVTERRLMPPWKPRAGHGEFQGNRSLSDAQIALLRKWVEAGTPEGDAAAQPSLPRFSNGWKLGTPDTILKVPQPFTVPAEGQDIYQHFVFSLGAPKERYLVGIEVRPSNRRVTHHAIGLLDSSGKARQIDAETPEPGFRNMGAPTFVPTGFTPGYVPGSVPRRIAEDSAIVLPKGADLVMQMHYHPTGRTETDQTEIGLYFTDKKPSRHPVIALLGSNDIDIKSGNSSYRVADEFQLPSEMLVTGIWAHMHLIGKDVKVWAELPDGTTRKLLWIDDWDFNWQDSYIYNHPIALPKGTKIKSEYTFDNSASNPRNPNQPPQRILTGENSTDEMAGLIVNGYANDGLGALAIYAADIGHYFEIEGKATRARAEAEKVKRAKAKTNRTSSEKEKTPDSIGLLLFYGTMSGGSGLAVAMLLQPVATVIILLFVLTLLLAVAAWLFPKAAQDCEQNLRAHPLRCLLYGTLSSAILTLLALALLFAPGKGGQGLGMLLMFGLGVAAVRGIGGIVRIVSRRIGRETMTKVPLHYLLLGGIAISGGMFVPLLGWFVVAPLVLFAAIGAGLPHLRLQKRQKELRTTSVQI